ncbi:MAG: hypothetical protein M0Z69_13190, partial [Actinomycetota bacterium]|nr:hypothetical protein [Actinomycetota bacterium]
MSSAPNPAVPSPPPAATRRAHAAQLTGDPRKVGRGIVTLVATAAAIFAVGLLLGLAFVGRHGGGAIQGWDDRVQTFDVHHRF